MSDPTADRLEALLVPTDDAARWRDELAALDRGAAVELAGAALADTGRPSRERIMAALALGALGDPGAAPALLAAMGGDDEVLRARAAEALGSLEPLPAAAVDRLTEALGEDSPFVRETAARALGRGRVASAVAALEAVRAGDPEPAVRAAAGEALEGIRS